MDLMNIDLSLARLTGAYIVECNLRNAWLLRAELDGAHLVESHFDGARFDGARMLGTRLMGSRYPGATFEGQAFDHIVWTERDFDFYEVMSEENTLWLLRRYGEVDVEESLQYWRQRKGGKNPPSPTDEFAPTW